MGEVRIGTSGWSYPAGPGTWNGLFYPLRADPGSRRRVDELAYYAQFFDTVEVNSTFYRQPSAAVTRRWVTRTPQGFEFSVKLFQRLTHPVPVGRGVPDPAGPTGPDQAIVPAVPEGVQADVDEFRAGVDPIEASGKLGAVLAQFPPGFKDSERARDYLAWLLRVLAGYQVAVELRHRSWSDASRATSALLEESGAAWVQIDEPKFQFSIRQAFQPNIPGCYYMRLHGRNAAKWWQHDTPDERYNYLYSPEELQPIAGVTAAASRDVRKAYLYLNNHFAAKAVVNATILKHQLGEPISGEYPPELVEAYPELRGIVSVRRAASSQRLPWDTER
jgi:uncharacterized protein YecE (DUF72 family)